MRRVGEHQKGGMRAAVSGRSEGGDGITVLDCECTEDDAATAEVAAAVEGKVNVIC